MPAINTQSKQAVIDAYRQYYLPGEAAIAAQWTGSISPVNPGTTASTFRLATLQRINWYRRMAGVGLTVFDPQLNARCQAAALMVSAAGEFTPYPPAQIPATWPCYTADGAAAAQRSSLALGSVGPNLIAGYVADTATASVGHRHNLLHPFLLSTGAGDIPPNAGGGMGANALWSSVEGQPRVDALVAWPPAGYSPILGPTGSFAGWPSRWSFTIFRADASSVTGGGQATALVKKNGQQVFSGSIGNWDMSFDQPTHGDVYDVTISNYYVDGTPQTFTYEVKPIDPDAPKLANVSTRLRVETGDNVGIAGFVVAGDQPRRVVIRGIGPSLTAFGVSDALVNPKLTVRDSRGAVVAQNDDWQTVLPTTLEGVRQLSVGDTGLAPSSPLEAAVALSLQPGSYTAVVEGVSGTTGVGLVEVYDLDPANADSQAVNVSTRGRVLQGDSVMIGGFVVHGTKAIKVVVRALGPSLSAFGVTGVLSDPMLEVRDAAGNLVAASDDTSSADGPALGNLLPTDSREAAVRLSLAPGSYTAIVRGKGGTTGVALVEAYEVK